MRKVLFLLAGTAVLWVPAVSVAGDSPSGLSKLAAKAEAHRVTNGLSNSVGMCENQHSGSSSATHRAETSQGVDNGLAGCSATSAKHKVGKDSADRSGEDSAVSHGKSTESHGNPANPAMTCKGMESNDATGFQAAYGTRPNAFGKCVSAHAHGNHG